MILLFVLILLFPNEGSFYVGKWVALLSVILLGVAKRITETHHWSVAAAFFYFSSYALLFGNSYFQDDFSQRFAMALSGNALDSLSAILLFIFLINIFEWEMISLMKTIWLFGSLFILFGIDIVGNKPMGACLIVMTLPFFISKKNWWLTLLITSYIVVTSTGSTAYASLLAMLAGLTFWAVTPLALQWVGILSSLCGIFFIPNLLNDSGRFNVQLLFLQHWWQDFNHLFGAGPGSFVIWSAEYYKHKALYPGYTDPDFWAWAHSDLLQVLFEYGFIGVFLIGLVFFFSLKKTLYSKPRLAGALCAYAATALNYFPSHWPIHAVVGMLLVSVATKKSLQNTSSSVV